MILTLNLLSAEEEEWSEDAGVEGGSKRTYSDQEEGDEDNDAADNDMQDDDDAQRNEDSKGDDNEECNAEDTFEGEI